MSLSRLFVPVVFLVSFGAHLTFGQPHDLRVESLQLRSPELKVPRKAVEAKKPDTPGRESGRPDLPQLLESRSHLYCL